jgi:UDP-N-acetylmuramoyl-L-alanyl-D-glutamate--2,6-diaminopimelate ligase
MASYAAAKARLFDDYGAPIQVLNADDAECARLLARPCPAGGERIGFSLTPGAAPVCADQLSLQPQGLMFELHTPWGEVLVTASLLGRFNVANLLLVSAVLGGLGYELGNIASALAALKPVSGRMECLAHEGAPTVIVDYAHTPDALEKALQAAREHLGQQARLWALFGCGGDRDRAKRPLMGKIAAQLADEVVLTSDNPRTEDPHAIISMIEQGVPAGQSVQVEPDRARAIAQVVRQAQRDDIILLAGKGHETYQEIHGVRHPFSDQAHVRAAQQNRSEA